MLKTIFHPLGEPNNAGNEDCGEFYTGDATWNDIDCYYHKHYMCEKRGITSSVIGDEGEEEECDANESCCFKFVLLLTKIKLLLLFFDIYVVILIY